MGKENEVIDFFLRIVGGKTSRARSDEFAGLTARNIETSRNTETLRRRNRF